VFNIESIKSSPFARLTQITYELPVCPTIILCEHPADTYGQPASICKNAQQPIFPVIVFIAKVLVLHRDNLFRKLTGKSVNGKIIVRNHGALFVPLEKRGWLLPATNKLTYPGTQ
jgi:hypothetical protein